MILILLAIPVLLIMTAIGLIPGWMFVLILVLIGVLAIYMMKTTANIASSVVSNPAFLAML